ncbi:MAG TPA: hypothetical protein VLB76_24125 [Thermoanaerobaculia bacterium]|jgi:hypothetical protein|nr:hypothetical protein [Thermoanaerobaculia bacterium]
MKRTLLVPLAIAFGAVSGFHCAAAQKQTSPTHGDTEQRPFLSLEPAAAPPGTTLAAKGSGFRGDCGVRLYFDSESGPPLGASDVDRSGSFTARLIISEQATGEQHVVLARGLRPGANGCVEPSGNRAQTPFALEPRTSIPTLAIDTIEARPGKAVHVEGRGFCTDPRCSNVTVLIDGQIAAGDVKVSPAGTFSAAARVPATKTAGKIAVAAVQTLADQSEIRAFGELEVTPRPNVRREPVR